MRVKVSKGKTIAQVVKDGLCTGCGTCVGTCPVDAIEMVVEHKRGIYIPQLDEEKCNQCGLCFEVCPGHAVDFKQLNLEIFGKEPEDVLIGNYLNCYIGYATDYNIRYNASSGGMVTALLIYALEQGMIDGALVTRMKKDKPLEPEPFIARTKDEIIEAAKSKYCPVPANIALKEILMAKEGERFAVVGLPCHVHGIRKGEMVNPKLRERIVLHIGIFCGTNTSFLGTEFQLRRMGIRGEEVAKLNYRGEGWPGSMTVELKSGQRKLSELYYYYYDSKFCSFVSWRCSVCTDQASELADVSLGDAWLPEVTETDKVGSSIIVARSKTGDDILQQAADKGEIELRLVRAEKVIESQRGFLGKKKDSKARLNTSRRLGKKVPVFSSQLLSPSVWSYFLSGLLYSESFLASKRYCWGLLNVYCSLLGYIGRLKSKLGL